MSASIKYEHLIWDWNGTLFADVDFCVEQINALLSKRRLPLLTRDGYRSIFDFPVRDYYTKIGFDFTRESWDTVAQEFMADYEVGRFGCGLQEGAQAVLDKCAGLGIEQSILSAYTEPSLRQLVGHFELERYFKFVAGQSNYYAEGKLDVGRRLMDQIPVPRDKVLFIGDTTHDYEVARGMGANVALVTNGHQSKEKLEACGVPLLASLSQLPELLGAP